MLVKSLYDYAKSKESKLSQNGPKNSVDDAPSELVLDFMDEEQIWQQLELQVGSTFRVSSFRSRFTFFLCLPEQCLLVEMLGKHFETA